MPSSLHAQSLSSVETLLELFEGPLRDVRFPGADAASLAAAMEELHAARVAVAQADAAAAAARVALTEKDAQLSELSQRTLAYARVYAQGNAELLAKLPDVGRSAERARRRAPAAAVTAEVSAIDAPLPSVRRGRPRKAPAEEAQSAE